MRRVRRILAPLCLALITTACAPAADEAAEVIEEVVESPTHLLPSGAYDLTTAGPDGPVVLRVVLGSDDWAEFTQDGELHVRTHVARPTHEEVIFHDEAGSYACRANDAPINGHYHVARTAEGWRFHLIADECEGRRGALTTGLLTAVEGSSES
jgi:hypothetical protein